MEELEVKKIDKKENFNIDEITELENDLIAFSKKVIFKWSDLNFVRSYLSKKE